MSDHRALPRVLADWRLVIYSLGLLAILVVRRTLGVESTLGVLLTGVALTAMVGTYAAELWVTSDPPSRRPVWLLVGIVGLAIGATAMLAGYVAPGLVFAAGGLFFVRSGATHSPEGEA